MLPVYIPISEELLQMPHWLSFPGHGNEQGVVQAGRQVLPAQSMPEL